ncbi:arsinothricin resistance N-acetyltransferase ArsN1 family A [Paenactinomyces guangxiensis]|uniref:N-acetyltransferase n=1 Tax=Paenactinomyces guangxiensis TaxID=1490290 RepID=A0A7W1WNA8_9BACL|nr:arsinothricin resistance N-acetyltransferase ArsN1 family A [Paenactinomyces guangxiensis]MBA4492956.1 N-acetyltransferase [Paenactinomyces guangxiensis]MBH8590195.1 N-acetyltransferase [Paenactinomyces guangxiensis]
MDSHWKIREAVEQDIPQILNIYNQGIEDRIATLESKPKNLEQMIEWYQARPCRYTIVISHHGEICGWASLNPYSHRCAYRGVADLSVYIDRQWRGKGLGFLLLQELERKAKENGFHKIVLFTFPFNLSGQGLYRKAGYREVGVFHNQGMLDGQYYY